MMESAVYLFGYILSFIVSCSFAYQLGWVNGNQKGFEQCSNIWQIKTFEEAPRRNGENS